MKWIVSLLWIVLAGTHAMGYAATGPALVISASATTLSKGQSATLTCTILSSSGASSPCTSPWFGDNAGGTIVSLSGNTMTGFSVGTVTVTGYANGLSGSLTVNVVPPAQEPLGAIPVTQALGGLGFNVTPQNDWEFALAAAAGATHVRFQCGWGTAELQTAPPLNKPASPRYQLQDYCQAAFASAKKYGLHPTVLAAYGSPYHAILSVTVPGGAAAGATSLAVQFSSGQGGDTLGSLRPIFDTIISADGYTFLTPKHSYAGSLITAVTPVDATHATLTLSSALSSALPANASTVYTINEYLYAPPASSSPTDTSVQAFASFAQFLAQSIAGAGLSGEVELWNEPPWPDDAWDNRLDFYDTPPQAPSPGPTSQWLPNWGIAAALQGQSVPAGVTFLWGGTEKSGTNSLLDPGMAANTGVASVQPASSVTSESFHPYGNNPEDAVWSAPCLAATTGNNDFYSCNLFGGPGGNFSLAAQYTVLQQRKNPAYGVAHNITETGFSLAQGDSAHQARFAMRQFLGFQAAGVTPIEFYRLFDPGAEQLGFVDSNTQQPLPAYTALAGLMSDLKTIQGAPVAGYNTASSLASVVSYAGTLPLDTVHLVGARNGDTRNSEMLALWQRSIASSGARWAQLPQPAAVPVTLALPAGVTVSKAVNLDTRAAVPYAVSGQQITLSVSDDPIGLLLVPAAVTPQPASISLSGLAQTYTGAALGATVTTVPAGLSFAITYGASSTPPTQAGSYNVVATVISPGYAAASASGTLSIVPATPTITWSPAAAWLPDGVAVGSGVLNASSVVPGAFSYTASASGGSMFALSAASTLPPGSYTLNVAFTPADGQDYTGATASVPLLVVHGSLFVAGKEGTMTVVSPAGSVLASRVAGGGLGAVVDPAGTVWSLNADGAGISTFSPQGALAASNTAANLTGALALTVDGAGQVWVLEAGGALCGLSNAGTSLFGAACLSPGLSAPSSMTVDASGSLWVTNAGENSVTEIFGLAAPVVPAGTSGSQSAAAAFAREGHP